MQKNDTFEVENVQIETLEDEALSSLAGGCGGMPRTCGCWPDIAA